MTSNSQAFLFDLLNTPSPTGFESAGQRKWANHLRPFSRVESDAYGSAWATIDGADKDAPTLMIEAHADEIGYIVKNITSEGYLYVDRIGGSDWATARGRRLVIQGDKGEVKGVIGNTAIHIRDRPGSGEKVPDVHDLYVDIGASTVEDVEEMGVRVGHPAVYADSAEIFGDRRIVGRALDNRIGGYIIARVMENLSEKKNPADATVIALNAVQEEIGGFGAKMAAQRLLPDICLVLDVTHATDTPGIKKEKHGMVILGAGPSVTHGAGNHIEMVKRLMAVAEECEVPIQHESASRNTGTDTDSIYHVGDGIPCALVSLPLRYMHSVIEMADLDDVEKTIQLMTAFARSVKASDEFKVKI
jgi:putative aminopeptidase FrvX